MISVQGLTKRYGDKVALQPLDLELPAGEVFAFLGPNGAGKTTTIKILTGLVRPTEGRARIGGHDIVADPLAAKRLLSYVPDEPYLYDKLTAREFLRMVGELYGMAQERIETQIERFSVAFDLAGFMDELCESFSHGMKQRVVLTAALLHEPKVLVIDEPMVGLDPKNVRTLKDILRKLADEEDLTVFVSTHTLSVAEELADRIGILSQGRLIALGTLQELREMRRRERASGGARLEDLFLELTDRPSATE